MLNMINPAGAPPPQFYSQGVEATGAQRILFISGQVGVDASGKVGADIGEQARIASANLSAVLAEAGMSSANLVKTTIYLTDAAHMQGFMEAAASTLPSPPPATTLLIVKALASPALLVEIEGVAVA